MSLNIPRSQYRKKKDHVSINKENVEVQKNNNLIKDKNSCKSNKGLSVNYLSYNPIIQVQKSFLNETKFKIHYDDEEHFRSRSRVRKDTLNKTVLCRARSSSNCRNSVSSDKKAKINNKCQRSQSENRKTSSQDALCAGTVSQHAHIQKTRHLSAEVKKRTFTSIEMWKNKMRKPYTGTVPKNLAAKYPNVDKVHTKIKLRKSAEHVKGLPKKSSNLQSEIDPTIKQNKNIKESIFSVIKHLPNEIVPILQDNNLLNTRVDINTSTNNIAENDEQNDYLNIGFEVSSTTSITPLDGLLLPAITPAKVRYLKRDVTHYGNKLLNKKEDFENIHPYGYDYLEEVPRMERKRENNTPKLSFHFLKQNVNADQRRIVVGYLIRLGVHLQYSSNIIYQTVKLFDIAIDRILVDTDNIQLMALACLWITLKREIVSHKIPSATTIVEMAKDLYIGQEKDLLMYERKIILAVDFNLRFADPFSLIFYYILNVIRDNIYNVNSNNILHIYFCGSYLLDISMLDENLCDKPVYVLAMAAAELSFCSIYSDNIGTADTWCKFWSQKYSLKEWEETAMSFTKQTIIRQALANTFGSNIVYKKYLHSKRGKVSNFLLDKLKKSLCKNN
ncbi:uncharacterized protein [Anoplolepis gracilipes]|uniref:uncharacterized protein n=1 Tax=Anoplolepis gracilipes TaxID=354296 RepID=UPI003BA17012